VLREAEVALFPNVARAHKSASDGMHALRRAGNPLDQYRASRSAHRDAAFRLSRQAPISSPGFDTRDWAASEVEEIVEALEAVWCDRDDAAAIDRRGTACIAPNTWRRQRGRLLQAIDPFLP
jgi:hypothetical protein